MRLWTLHPAVLDPPGLVALWREALLAQAVLRGRTRGYTNHPQLQRFRDTPAPVAAIGAYLLAVHAEATLRGYRFDASRIAARRSAAPIRVTRGQVEYEWSHLEAKLAARAPTWLAGLATRRRLRVHPVFRVIPGPVEDWEVAAHRKERL